MNSVVQRLPVVPIEPAVAEIVSAYMRHKLMPADPTGDALHLALASLHKCDFLLTWNCTHLAKRKQIRTHPTAEHDAGTLRPYGDDATRIAGRDR